MASFLTAFTDRPSSLPAGVQMSPYISGTNYGDHFIITRTIADDSASRGGMVFTHALIINTNDLAMVNDLNRVFALFVPSKPKMLKGLKPLNFPATVQAVSSSVALPTKDSQEIAAGLIANQLPVVFCGELSAFETAISTIWNGLPASFRKTLTFTVSFSPANLDRGKKLVYVQPSLASAFKNTPITGGKNELLATDLSEAEKYILIPEETNGFDRFIRELQVVMNDWSILTPSVKAYHLYQKLHNDISPDEVRLLVRLMARISPSSEAGTDIKKEVIAHLSKLIKSGMDINVKALRNLGLQEFKQGPTLLSSSITDLLSGMFAGQPQLDVAFMLDLYRAIDPISGEKWWSQAVTDSLSDCSSSTASYAIDTLWILLGHANAPLNSILNQIPVDIATSKRLSAHLPSDIPTEAAGNIAILIRPRKWYLLHAQLMRIAKPIKAAVTEQFQFEKSTSDSLFQGTKFLISELPDADLLDLCLEFADNLFIAEYAARSIKAKTLLNPLNVTNNTWLRIWAESLEKTKDLLHGITDLSAKVVEIFDELLQGKSIPKNILALLAESEYSDLTDINYRSALWKKLPIAVQPKFLRSTAQAFLKRLADGEKFSIPEQELSAEIGQDQVITMFLSKYRGQMSAVVNVYESVPGLKDRFLGDYISYYQTHLSEALSIRLGNLIAANHFKISARQVFEKAKHDQTYHSALSICSSLIDLGFWEQFLYGHLFGHTVSESEIYGMLLKISLRLYDKGPEDNDIWKRAGGENSKLSNNRNREESWRDAIEMLRTGGGGKHANIRSLLKAMQEDNPNNDDLKELSNYFRSK